MNFQTAYNHVTRLKNKVDSIYGSAMHYCPTHLELIATITKDVREDSAWKRLPGWAQQSVNDHDQAKFSDIQRNWTIWLFPQPEGPALSWDEMPEDVRKTYCSGDKKGETYWLRRVTPSQSYSHTYGKREGRNLVRTFEITSKEW